MTDSKSHPAPAAKHSRPAKQVENTTDATRGKPLAARAKERKLELEVALDKLPAEERRIRNDISVALATFDALLTGDVDHLSDTTAAGLNRALESSKHLAETNPRHRRS